MEDAQIFVDLIQNQALNLLFSDLNHQQSSKLTHHRMVGAGLPFARHLNVTLAPSLTTTSVDVWASSIFGGTLFVHCVVDENDDIFFSSSVNYRLTFIHENKKKRERRARGEKVIYLLTDNMQIPELGFGCHCVYLTHVSSLVLLLHIGDVQEPGFVLIVLVMCHWDSRIPSNYVIMHSQYCRLLEVHPSHLQ